MTDKENKPHEGGIPNGGVMQTHDDWATAPPMEAVETTLFKAYAKELFIREITVFKYRQTRMNNKIQRYFNSTPTRNALARVLCLATYVNQPYTKTEISEQLGVSRQAVHDLIEECAAEGWAELAKPESRKRYRASPTLVEAGESYAKFNFDTVRESGVVDAFAALASFQKLRQAS
jgi:biotin operon repressor